MQDSAAYNLSGASSFRLLLWLYGPKGTGKSTFTELQQTAMGTAARALDWALVSGDRDAEALGRAVRGARAVFLPEAGRKRLDPEILKLLTGSDRLPCRELYQSKTISVPPTWALIATSNDAPDLTAYDGALRDRVVALPFNHQLADGGKLTFTGGRRLEEVRRDPDSRLVRGFVAWAVSGLDRVHRDQSIRVARSVERHTQQFWIDTDPLTPFWSGLSEQALRAGMPAADLRASYLAWCFQEGLRKPLQGRAWGQSCRSTGLEDDRDKHARLWILPEGAPWPYGGDGFRLFFGNLSREGK